MLHELIEYHEQRARAEIQAFRLATIQHPRGIVAIHRRLIENTAPIYAEIARLEGLKTTVEVKPPFGALSCDVMV